MLRHPLLPLAFVTLAACSGDKTGDTADTSSTTDTADTTDTSDTSDTTDTSDTAVTSDFGTFSGTVSYVETVDGETNCDADIALTGSAFSGDCADCTFAFAIDAEITRDGSTADCAYNTVLSWLPDPSGMLVDPGFVFWETLTTDYGDYANVAATSVGYYYYGYTYPGPYFQYWAAEGAVEGASITKSGNDVSWAVESSTTESTPLYFNDCGTGVSSEDETAATGTVVGTDDVACDASTFDVWTLDVTGGIVGIFVDTVAAETTFDPVFWINGPDTCTGYLADDNADCTFAPANYSCPSWTGELEAGSYQLVVTESAYDTSECVSGTVGAYALTVSGATATVFADDTAATADGATTVLTVNGSGTITP